MTEAFPRKQDDMPGMTLRDYFAAAAMQGILAGDVDPPKWHGDSMRERLAGVSYALADLMLKVREGRHIEVQEGP